VFTLFLDHAHRVLLSCFTGRFTLDEIAQCDRAVMLTLGREGPVRGIIDLTDVNAVDIPEDRLRERARQPPMAAGQERIFVATSPSALAFAYSYAAIQREFGSIGLQIVGTRSEACQRLGLHHPTFEPVPLP
jgi:hypothetical protein